MYIVFEFIILFCSTFQRGIGYLRALVELDAKNNQLTYLPGKSENFHKNIFHKFLVLYKQELHASNFVEKTCESLSKFSLSKLSSNIIILFLLLALPIFDLSVYGSIVNYRISLQAKKVSNLEFDE